MASPSASSFRSSHIGSRGPSDDPQSSDTEVLIRLETFGVARLHLCTSGRDVALTRHSHVKKETLHVGKIINKRLYMFDELQLVKISMSLRSNKGESMPPFNLVVIISLQIYSKISRILTTSS